MQRFWAGVCVAVLSLGAAEPVHLAAPQSGQDAAITFQGADLSDGLVTAAGSPTPRALRERFGEAVNVLDFIPAELHAGIRDGANTTPLQEYLQAALDTASGYQPVMKGLKPVDELDFGDTLHQPRACSVYFPLGTYLITDRLFIPPHCKIYGEKYGENWSRTGSCILVRIDNPDVYAVQVKQFGRDGKQHVDHLGQPDEPNKGIATNGEGIEIGNLTFVGDFKCKGLSLNSWYCGSIENVTLWNFIVGIRVMNSWCSSIEDTHVSANWRGLILDSTNIIDLRNVFLSHEGRYTPDPAHPDGSEGPPFGGWTWERQQLSAAIYAVWSVWTAQSLTIDGDWEVGFSFVKSKADTLGTYAEGVRRVLVQAASERNYGGIMLRFADLRTDNAALVWNQGARITLTYDGNDLACRYKQVYEYVDPHPADSEVFPVVLNNFPPKPDDTVDHSQYTRTHLIDRLNFEGGVYHFYVDAQNGRSGFSGKTEGDPLPDFATAVNRADLPGATVQIHLQRGQTYRLNSPRTLAAAKVVIDAWGHGAKPILEFAGQENGSTLGFVSPGQTTLIASDVEFRGSNAKPPYLANMFAQQARGTLNAVFADCDFKLAAGNGILGYLEKHPATYQVLFSNCTIGGHNDSFGAISWADPDNSPTAYQVTEHAFNTPVDPNVGAYQGQNADVTHSDLFGIVSLPTHLPTRPPAVSGQLWVDPEAGHVIKMAP